MSLGDTLVHVGPLQTWLGATSAASVSTGSALKPSDLLFPSVATVNHWLRALRPSQRAPALMSVAQWDQCPRWTDVVALLRHQSRMVQRALSNTLARNERDFARDGDDKDTVLQHSLFLISLLHGRVQALCAVHGGVLAPFVLNSSSMEAAAEESFLDMHRAYGRVPMCDAITRALLPARCRCVLVSTVGPVVSVVI